MARRLDVSGGEEYKPGFPSNTICEVHRKLFWLLKYHPDRINDMIPLVQEAFVMGKKMSNKLKQYKDGQGVDWYQAHKLDGGKLDENEF